MTKSGQGALIKVMEDTFAMCIEKARENQQGTGSAVLRRFHVQSISEVKSQLERMHLIFGALGLFAAGNSDIYTLRRRRARPRQRKSFWMRAASVQILQKSRRRNSTRRATSGTFHPT